MEHQRAASSGKVDVDQEEKAIRLLQNAQRLLKPIKVVNPWASFIDLPDQVFKPRRTLSLLLGFIEAVTFYHQYQRKVSQDAQGRHFVESSPEDVEIAFDLLKEVLFTKGDELSHACRKFFERLKKENSLAEGFSQREVRERLRVNPHTLKRYLRELSAYGKIKIIGGSQHRGYQYSIIDAGEYGKLTGSIERQLDSITGRIRAKSGSVDHSGSAVVHQA